MKILKIRFLERFDDFIINEGEVSKQVNI